LKETSKLQFPTRSLQGRTRQHTDGINAKLQKIPLVNYSNNQNSCYFVSLQMCLRYFRTRFS